MSTGVINTGVPECTAFKGNKKLISGALTTVALKVKEETGINATGVLVFDNQSSEQIDLDLRGTNDEIITRINARYENTKTIDQTEPSGRPGRPRLGVVAREVTLLPRHWQWLSQQPGGASVALRKLVDQARSASTDRATIRQSQEATYRFMSAMAGNAPDFEEAARALFASDRALFEKAIKTWPGDIKKHILKLASCALATV